MARNITTKTTILNLTSELKKTFAKKTELTPIQNAANAAFKSGLVTGNKVELFTSADKTGTAAFSFDFPVELVLDQTKTAFVPAFTWSEDTYPGSADPSLEGKPVMVLAVKGSDGSVTYSFMDMAQLVDTYKAKTTGKDASTTVEVAGYEIDVKVNISAEEGNSLELKADGLYVNIPAVDLSGKADKDTDAVEGNLAAFDANGNPVDSGKKAEDFVAAVEGERLMTDAEGVKLEGIQEGATKVEASETNGNILINGQEQTVYTLPETVVHESDISDYTAEEIATLLADDAE